MHSKQWHYSLHRDFQNCYSTRRSPTGFFSSNSSSNSTRVPMQHLHLHVCTLHYTSIQRILHPEIQFYMQKAKSSSSTTTTRNSTHRRQGDLLEIHPCVLQDIQVTPVTPVAPETFQSFQTFRTFQSFMTFQPFQAILQILHCSSISRESTPFQHSPTRMHILQFLQILQFDWFP